MRNWKWSLAEPESPCFSLPSSPTVDTANRSADAQIRDFAPAREAYKRLIDDGISESDARVFIANLVTKLLWVTQKSERPYDPEMHAEWLRRLPDLPDDEEIDLITSRPPTPPKI